MSVGDEIEVFREFLHQRGYRHTPERELILREIFSRHDHFDIDELHFRLKRKGGKISKASIYRLVPLLLECGLIQDVFFEDGHMHYERIYGRGHHCHLRCVSCRRVLEFDEQAALREIESRVSDKLGVRITSHKLEFFGLCPECQAAAGKRDKETECASST
jgi:Fur family ferric uptake transcriptional regulator